MSRVNPDSAARRASVRTSDATAAETSWSRTALYGSPDPDQSHPPHECRNVLRPAAVAAVGEVAGLGGAPARRIHSVWAWYPAEAARMADSNRKARSIHNQTCAEHGAEGPKVQLNRRSECMACPLGGALAAPRIHGREKRRVMHMFLEEKPHLPPVVFGYSDVAIFWGRRGAAECQATLSVAGPRLECSLYGTPKKSVSHSGLVSLS
jgi:hypothetical protein